MQNVDQIIAARYSSVRVMVTGASGFIGAQLCRRLHQYGAEVIAVSRAEVAGPHPVVPPEVQWRKVCYEEERDVCKMVREINPGVIFHTSALAVGNQDVDYVRPTLAANLISTINLATAAVRNGAPDLILLGSMDEPDLQTENSFPISPYAASKEVCSTYAKLYANLYQLPIINYRLFMTYGPHEYSIRRMIPYTILSLANGVAPKLGPGTRNIDWVYVDDVLEGLLRAALVDRKTAQRIDLGTGRMVSVQYVVETIAKIMETSIDISFGRKQARVGQEQEEPANILATKAQLDWAPSVQIEQGLKQTIRWYCDRKDFFQQEWMRIHQ